MLVRTYLITMIVQAGCQRGLQSSFESCCTCVQLFMCACMASGVWGLLHVWGLYSPQDGYCFAGVFGSVTDTLPTASRHTAACLLPSTVVYSYYHAHRSFAVALYIHR